MQPQLPNFEKEARIQEWSLASPSLSCDQLHQIVQTLSFSSKQRAVLMRLHPLLDDPEHFAALLERTLDYAGDRREVHAAVVAAGGPPSQLGGTIDLPRLMRKLRGMATSFEAEQCLAHDILHATLECAQLGVIVEAFTFSERRMSVLVKFYPRLLDPQAFPSLLDDVLRLSADRAEVLRELQLR